MRHPFGGDVSCVTPGAEGTAPFGPCANSTLFAIFLSKLLQPPLKVGTLPCLPEEIAEGVPLALREVDAHLILLEPKRALRRPLFLGHFREEMPPVPRPLGRQSFEHRAELG